MVRSIFSRSDYCRSIQVLKYCSIYGSITIDYSTLIFTVPYGRYRTVQSAVKIQNPGICTVRFPFFYLDIGRGSIYNRSKGVQT
jgi:hypothetical protein